MHFVTFLIDLKAIFFIKKLVNFKKLQANLKLKTKKTFLKVFFILGRKDCLEFAPRSQIIINTAPRVKRNRSHSKSKAWF